MTPTAIRYTVTARVLHAVLGLSLVGLLAFGVWMTNLPISPLRIRAYNWHKWVGLTVLALSLVRLAWRLTHRPPALPDMPVWQRLLAQGVQVGMMVLFVALPLAGWAYSSAAGRPIVWFGWFTVPDLVPVDPDQAVLWKSVHVILAWTLAGLIGLHVAGALKHHLIDRDGLLSRMGWGPTHAPTAAPSAAPKATPSATPSTAATAAPGDTPVLAPVSSAPVATSAQPCGAAVPPASA